MSIKKSDQIIFAGDFVPCNKAMQTYQNSIDDEHSHNLRKIIQESKYSFVNLESALTNSISKIKKAGPSLKANINNAQLLKELSFTNVNLANNHICDYGIGGLDETINTLTQLNINFNGVRVNGVSRTYSTCEISNSRIAVFNFCENEFCTINESNGAELINPIENYRAITEKNDVAFKIVVLHGGSEHCALPNPWFRDLCKYYIDIGVDLVISHHTHVFSGSEVYKGKTIYYGLGNFVFSNIGAAESWYRGYLVKVNISDNKLESAIIPYEQMNKDNFVKILKDDDLIVFMEEYKRLSQIILNEAEYTLFWKKYTDSKNVDYLATALGMSRLTRGVFRKFGLRIKKRDEQKKLLRLMNHIYCQSHNYNFRAVLKKVIGK